MSDLRCWRAPVEIFFHASQQVPGSYRVDVVGPAGDGQVTMSNGVKLGVARLPDPPRRHDTLGRRRR
jgi:hypothetical protein